MLSLSKCGRALARPSRAPFDGLRTNGLERDRPSCWMASRLRLNGVCRDRAGQQGECAWHRLARLSHEPETLHPNPPARATRITLTAAQPLRGSEKRKGRRESRQPRDKTGNVQLYKPRRELGPASVGCALSRIWGGGQGRSNCKISLFSRLPGFTFSAKSTTFLKREEI